MRRRTAENGRGREGLASARAGPRPAPGSQRPERRRPRATRPLPSAPYNQLVLPGNPLLLAGCPPTAPCPPRPLQDYFELGVILLRKKLFTQATKNLEKARKGWDGEPEELAQVGGAGGGRRGGAGRGGGPPLGRAALRCGSLSRCMEACLERERSLGPGWWQEPFSNTGRPSPGGTGAPTPAPAFCARPRACAPRRARSQVHNALGYSYFNQEKLGEAVAEYKKAVALQVRSVTLHYITTFNIHGVGTTL